MMKSGSLSFDSGDVVLERDCGTHKAAVLCGGACGEKAARLTAEALAGLLSFGFERCMTDQPAELWREAAATKLSVPRDDSFATVVSIRL